MITKKENSGKQFREFVQKQGLWKSLLGIKPEEKPDEEGGENKKNRKPAWVSVIRFVRELRDERANVLTLLVLGLLGNVFEAAIPWSSKIMIDSVLPRKNSTLLIGVCGLLAIIVISRVILFLFQDIMTNTLRGRSGVAIKLRLMKHLQTLPLVKLQEIKTGGIISRLQQDTEAMCGLFQIGLLTPFNALVMFSVGIVSLLFVSAKLSLMCLCFCLIMGGLAYFIFNVMRPFQRNIQKDNATINAGLTEAFGGAQVVRSFGREK